MSLADYKGGITAFLVVELPPHLQVLNRMSIKTIFDHLYKNEASGVIWKMKGLYGYLPASEVCERLRIWHDLGQLPTLDVPPDSSYIYWCEMTLLDPKTAKLLFN